MSFQHPLTAQLKPYLIGYPEQANALFQSFLDLSLAQAWKDVEVVELKECGKIIVKGRAKGKPSWVLPMSLTQPTTIAEFSAVFPAVASLAPSPSPSASKPSAEADSSVELPPAAGAPTKPTEAETIYLGIVEKDSSVVYYVLKRGIWSPREVPE